MKIRDVLDIVKLVKKYLPYADAILPAVMERFDAVQAERGDDGELSVAEIVEQVGKACLSAAEIMGEDTSTDGDTVLP